jgi:hypothetical protein
MKMDVIGTADEKANWSASGPIAELCHLTIQSRTA